MTALGTAANPAARLRALMPRVASSADRSSVVEGRPALDGLTLLLLALSLLVAAPGLNAFLLDLAGRSLRPANQVLLLALEVSAVIAVVAAARPRHRLLLDLPSLAGGASTFLGVLAVGVGLSGPDGLPASPAADALGHYVLVDYLHRYQSLVHGAAELPRLGAVSSHPFGAAALAAFLAGASAAPPLLAMHATAALVLAATAAFAYGLVAEMTPRSTYARAAALCVGPMLLWPAAYTLGQFVDAFSPTQMLGVACLLSGWLWLVRRVHAADGASLVGLFLAGAGLLFTEPTLLPLLGLAFLLAPLAARCCPRLGRLVGHAALLSAPLAGLAALYLRERVGVGPDAAGYDGAALTPSFAVLPPLFVLLAAVGAAHATLDRDLRPASVLWWLAVAQTLAFHVARGPGELSYDAAARMFFVLAPAMAVLGSVGIVRGLVSLRSWRSAASRRDGAAAPRALVALLLIAATEPWPGMATPAVAASRAEPPLNRDQVAAAEWLRANAPDAPLVYFGNSPITADWVEIGLLGRRPASRGGQGALLAGDHYWRWYAGDGPELALILEGLDALAGPEVETLFRRGRVGVVRRPSERRRVIDGRLLLTRAALATARVEPGEPIRLDLAMATIGRLSGHYMLVARARDPAGAVVAEGSVPLTPLDRPVDLPAGERIIRSVPVAAAGMRPGSYGVELHVFRLPAWESVDVGDDADRTVGRVLVGSASDLPTDGALPGRSVGAQLGAEFRLVGVDVALAGPRTVVVDLFWQAARPPSGDYTVFLQGLDESGRLVAQSDGYPWDGRYPTSSWQPGQTVRDRRRLVMPATSGDQRVHLIAGLYRLETGARLPVVDRDGRDAGDYVPIGELVVPVVGGA